jgi:hypothetical protein
MGYEGHVVGRPDRAERTEKVAESMALLVQAAGLVGGDVISAGVCSSSTCTSGAAVRSWAG